MRIPQLLISILLLATTGPFYVDAQLRNAKGRRTVGQASTRSETAKQHVTTTVTTKANPAKTKITTSSSVSAKPQGRSNKDANHQQKSQPANTKNKESPTTAAAPEPPEKRSRFFFLRRRRAEPTGSDEDTESEPRRGWFFRGRRRSRSKKPGNLSRLFASLTTPVNHTWEPGKPTWSPYMKSASRKVKSLTGWMNPTRYTPSMPTVSVWGIAKWSFMRSLAPEGWRPLDIAKKVNPLKLVWRSGSGWGVPSLNPISYMPGMPSLNLLSYAPSMSRLNPLSYAPSMPSLNPKSYMPSMSRLNPLSYTPSMSRLNPKTYLLTIPSLNPLSYTPKMPSLNPLTYTPSMSRLNPGNYIPSKPSLNPLNYAPSMPSLNPFNYKPSMPSLTSKLNRKSYIPSMPKVNVMGRVKGLVPGSNSFNPSNIMGKVNPFNLFGGESEGDEGEGIGKKVGKKAFSAIGSGWGYLKSSIRERDGEALPKKSRFKRWFSSENEDGEESEGSSMKKGMKWASGWFKGGEGRRANESGDIERGYSSNTEPVQTQSSTGATKETASSNSKEPRRVTKTVTKSHSSPSKPSTSTTTQNSSSVSEQQKKSTNPSSSILKSSASSSSAKPTTKKSSSSKPQSSSSIPLESSTSTRRGLWGKKSTAATEAVEEMTSSSTRAWWGKKDTTTSTSTPIVSASPTKKGWFGNVKSETPNEEAESSTKTTTKKRGWGRGGESSATDSTSSSTKQSSSTTKTEKSTSAASRSTSVKSESKQKPISTKASEAFTTSTSTKQASSAPVSSKANTSFPRPSETSQNSAPSSPFEDDPLSLSCPCLLPLTPVLSSMFPYLDPIQRAEQNLEELDPDSTWASVLDVTLKISCLLCRLFRQLWRWAVALWGNLYENGPVWWERGLEAVKRLQEGSEDEGNMPKRRGKERGKGR